MLMLVDSYSSDHTIFMSSVRKTISLPPTVAERLDKEAKRRKTSVSALVTELVEKQSEQVPYAGLIDDEGDPAVLNAFRAAVRIERIESLGTAAFFLKHHVTPPVVLVSASAHYSWEKGMKVLGFGTQNLIRVDVDDHMRMDLTDLDRKLEWAFAEHVPVLAVVGMLGTTEFGTVDPIHGIVAARERAREKHRESVANLGL